VTLISLARVTQSRASVNVSHEDVWQNGDMAPLIFNTGGYWSWLSIICDPQALYLLG